MSCGSTHPKIVAFVCLHGSAKSLIAAEYLTPNSPRARAQFSWNNIRPGTRSAKFLENVVAGLSEK